MQLSGFGCRGKFSVPIRYASRGAQRNHCGKATKSKVGTLDPKPCPQLVILGPYFSCFILGEVYDCLVLGPVGALPKNRASWVSVLVFGELYTLNPKP